MRVRVICNYARFCMKPKYFNKSKYMCLVDQSVNSNGFNISESDDNKLRVDFLQLLPASQVY